MMNTNSRNILLLCLDTVRKDFFDEYASRISEKTDIEFEQCRAASSWTIPSHGSMFTRKLPNRHGAHAGNPNFSGIKKDETFLSLLPDYHSISITSNIFLRNNGFNSMFDTNRSVLTGCWYPDGLEAKTLNVPESKNRYLTALYSAITHPHPIKSLINIGTTYIEATSRHSKVPRVIDDGATVISREITDIVSKVNEPFFLFANFMDAHSPHTPTLGYNGELYSVPWSWASDKGVNHIQFNASDAQYKEYVERYRQLYKASIEYLDRRVSSLVETILNTTDRETTIIITADHGENLGYEAEDGLIDHQGSLSEGVLHVPLCIINSPVESINLDNEYISHLRLGEFVAGIADGNILDISERTIAAERIGTSAADNLSAEEREYWDRSIRAVYEGGKKTVWDSLGNIDCYKLNSDRPCWQQSNTADTNANAYKSNSPFSIPIEQIEENHRKSNSNYSEGIKTHLEQLGYL